MMSDVPGREALEVGEAAGRRGDLDSAAAHFERALAENPRLAAAQFNLGVCRAAAGDMAAAAGCFGRAAALAPRFAAAHERQGSALNALGNYAEAAECFRRALRIHPHNAPALAYLGASLQLAGSFDDAEACYRRALAIEADNADAHCNLGKLCQATDRGREAAEHFEQALAVAPEHLVALAGIAMQLDQQGRYSEALERLGPHAGSRQPEIVIAHARALRRLGRHAEAAGGLEALLAAPNLPLDGRIQAHFSLAQVYDALGREAEACKQLGQGNALKQAHYDRARQTAATDQVMQIFDAAGLERLARSGNASERPVFVLGMPRAGKSLVEQVLASHPQVAGAGELTTLGNLTGDLSRRLGNRRPYPACVPDLSPVILERMAASYLATLAAAEPDAARVIDTLPGNFLHIGLIELLFPNARIVHVCRDARDLALACWFKNFAGRSLWFAFDLNDIAAYYADYRRLMAHWRQVSGLKMMAVSYEALVQDPETISRQLIEFLGLSWHGDCLRYFEAGVPKLSGAMTLREPLDAREIGRCARYAAYLDFSAFEPQPGIDRRA